MRGRAGLASVVVCALLTACAREAENRVATLGSDPMANYELASAVTTRSSESIGGYPVTPSLISRSFVVPDGEVEAALEEIALAAQDAGWTLREPLNDLFESNV